MTHCTGAIVATVAGNRIPVDPWHDQDALKQGIPAMWTLFNRVMRVVSTLVGLLMILMGSVWILQGLNLAFRVGFMVGQPKWTVYGALLALAGIGQVIWSNTRQRAP
jgi:hypothetical protein